MASATTGPKPLWLSMEAKIAELGPSDFEPSAREATVHRLAGELDQEGYNVSRHAGNMLMLRQAVATRADVGRPLFGDLTSATEALTLEDVANPVQATIALVHRVGDDFPHFKDLDRRDDIRTIIDAVRLDRLVAKARTLDGDKGVRYLIENQVEEPVIVERLEITDAGLAEVKAAIAAELAEVHRVKGLLKDVDGQDDDAKIRHLVNKDVADASIVEIAGYDQADIDRVKKAMEEEIREKERLAAEAAAAKKAAAEGPKLEDIPSEDLLRYIEEIREIMEFSDKPDEIRTMCEQSSIPKSLVEAVADNPDKLDELEAAAQG
jgi:hypothetical protein